MRPRSRLTRREASLLAVMLLASALGGFAACANVADDAGTGGAHQRRPPIVFDGGSYGTDVPLNLGTETECNGLDDNGNGVVDDVDLGHDGVCDCLHIATIGMAGGMDSGSIFKTWLASRSQFPVDQIDATTKLTRERLRGAMLIVVQDLRQRTYGSSGYATSEVDAFAEWLKGGGGALTLAGFSASVNEIDPTNQLLAPLGFSYEKPSNGQGYFGGGQPPLKLGGIVPGHEILAGITKVGIYYGYPVKGGGDLLVRDVDADDHQWHDMARAAQVGEGRLVVWGDEWITYDALWKGDDTKELDVPRLWLNMLKWLTPSSVCQVPIPDVIP